MTVPTCATSFYKRLALQREGKTDDWFSVPTGQSLTAPTLRAKLPSLSDGTLLRRRSPKSFACSACPGPVRPRPGLTRVGFLEGEPAGRKEEQDMLCSKIPIKEMETGIGGRE